MIEWDKIWPKWVGTLNNFRHKCRNVLVYHPRRHSLASEYANYLLHPSPNVSTFDVLPHAVDLARFPPFEDIIMAPEKTQWNDKLFESAFAQLPDLVDDWKKKLDAEVAELVKIPSHLSSTGTSNGFLVSSGSTASSEPSQTPTDTLRLACALFYGHRRGVFTYPEVFSISLGNYAYPSGHESDSHRSGSIKERYGIVHIEVAPYVIHACGLDPNVATVDDMDRLDLRLKCLHCLGSPKRWRDAVRLSFTV